MKKKMILAAIVLVTLLLFGFRYMVVERNDELPEAVRLSLSRILGMAQAETVDAGAEVTIEPTAEPTPEPTIEPRLREGDSGEEVKQIQQRLRELGFMTGAADGRFGPKTGQGVIDFKRHLYDMAQEEAEAAKVEEAIETEEANEILPAEEAIEPEAAMEAEPAAEEEAEPTFDSTVDEETYRLLAEKGFDEYQGKLTVGSSGAETRRLQQRLQTLGYSAGKADGVFGRRTRTAVIDFQRQHGLTQDGIAGEKTQRALYSASAKKYVAPTVVQKQKKGKPYLLKISTEKQRVYAYAWNEADGAYTKLARTMVCSTGLSGTPTPKGTYTNTTPVVRWGYFPKYDVWAQYLYRISGPYLFHSVLYEEADESTVKWGSVNKLGTPASHGCVRLSVEDARWIYNNCPAGTTVTVY